MSRYSFLGRAVDTYGNVQPNVDITIYLAGTTTGAIVYTERSGGVGVSTPPQITTDVYGAFKFYVDDGDYPLVTDQNFDVIAGGLTYPDLEIMRGVKKHHDLQELLDDDHPQYAALPQNEIVTGQWTFSYPVTGQTPTKDTHLATKDYVDVLITGTGTSASSISAASVERDNREREATNVQILSVSAASREQDQRITENILSVSATSVEQDTRLTENILSVSAASVEQDTRLTENILSVSAASNESDQRLNEYVDNEITDINYLIDHLSANKIIEGDSGVIVNDTGTGTITISADGSTIATFTNGEVNIDGDIKFPSSGQSGIIRKGDALFLHNFAGTGTYGANTFVGVNSGNLTMGGVDAEGSFNTGLGHDTLKSLTTGYYNVAIGLNSLEEMTEGDSNFGIGADAFRYNKTGNENVGIGNQVGRGVTENSNFNRNTLIGFQAGLELRTGGDNNILIGYKAGDNIINGERNILIGYSIDAIAPSGDYQLNIGNLIYGDLTNEKIGIGETSPDVSLHVSESGGIGAGQLKLERYNHGTQSNAWVWSITNTPGTDASLNLYPTVANADLLFSGSTSILNPFIIRSTGYIVTANGTEINEFSTDGTLAGDSDDALPTEKAVKTYSDNISAASREQDNREREATNVQILSVSGASDEADQRHLEWAITEFASTSAASVEQDNREREATNVQILSVSAASREQDNRLQENINVQIISVSAASDEADQRHLEWAITEFASTSAASREQDNRLQENIDVTTADIATNTANIATNVTNINSTSAASHEQDNRLQENIDTQIVSLSGSYVRTDGTIPLVANWDVGNYEFTNFAVHTVSSSTARDGLSAAVGGLVFQLDTTSPYILKNLSPDYEASLLIHSDTFDNDTVFTDDSIYEHTITGNNSIVHDTAEAALGNSSIYFNRASGQTLSIPTATNLNFAAEDFVIEGFIRFDLATFASTQGIWCKWGDTTGQREWLVYFDTFQTDKIRFWYSTTGYAATNLDFSWGAAAHSTMYHLCLARSGNDIRCFIDGVQIGSTLDMTGITIHQGTYPVWIGSAGLNGVPAYFHGGHQDEIRILKGTDAGRTSNFTPPITPYTNGQSEWERIGYYDDIVTANTKIDSVSAASDEADQRHLEWADTMFASTSAASREQDNKERETTNVQIISVSGASDEADQRHLEWAITEFTSTSAASLEGDRTLQDNIDNLTTDHGELEGLLDDDHSQYPLSDGPRGFSVPISGVSPIDPADLSTKSYSDSVSAASWEQDNRLQENIDATTLEQVRSVDDNITGEITFSSKFEIVYNATNNSLDFNYVG